MRIDRLDLMAYGPFTDQTIDLTAKGGIHVIYGPNEAGKSSSLRAIIDLLYGIPPRTGDSHLHKTTLMRIGALLRSQDGQPFDFVRKKGNKNTILGRDEKPHPQANELNALLGDVNRDIFSQMFAIDHERLREGGQSLEDGKGSLAESLFGAGLGNDVRETLKNLKAEAENIFKKTGSKPAFNVALKEFKEHKKEAADRTIRPQQWQDEHKLLIAEEEKSEELTEKLNTLSKRLTQLRRIGAIAPHLSNLRRIRSEIASLGAFTILPREATEDRRATQKAIADADNAAVQHAAHIENLKTEDSSSIVDPNILSSSDDIEAINKDVGQFEKDQKHAPEMSARLAEEDKAIRNALTDMGKKAPDVIDVEQVKKLLPPTLLQAELRALTNKRAGLDETLRERQERFNVTEKNLQDSEKVPTQSTGAEPSLELMTTLERVTDLGPFDRELTAAKASAEQKQEAAEQALRALGLFQGSLTEVMSLAVPNHETVRVFLSKFEDIDVAKRDCQKDIGNLEDGLRQLETNISQLTSSGDIATEDDLKEARA
ncbi:MAG: hypothetical protein ACI97A_004308, partial [Planctomycetota bacterium]